MRNDFWKSDILSKDWKSQSKEENFARKKKIREIMNVSENRYEILQDILKRTEDLLTIAGGRPLLQALHFGGVTRLSRRISHFLRHGAIHCERVIKISTNQ